MRVSYVVTVFNKARFLPHVAASLLAQQGDFEKEYIFVDDGSTDGSAELIEQLFAGTPLLQVIRQTNAGPAAALNRGFSAATGDYIKPLDGDDLIAPDATARLLAAMRACDCPVAYVPADMQQLYDASRTPAEVMAAFPPAPTVEPIARRIDDMRPISLRRANMNPTMWLAESGIIRRSGGCDARVFVQDYSIELRMAAIAPFAVLPECLMQGPAVAAGRLSDDGAQTLHDLTMAALLFAADHPEIPSGLRRMGIKRAVTRSWLWERRENPLSIGARIRLFAILTLAILGALRLSPPVIETVLEPFRRGRRLRLVK